MIKLSKYIDEQEKQWLEAADARLKPMMDNIAGELKRDLYKERKTKSALEVYQYYKFWLFATHWEMLERNLESFSFNKEQFQDEVLLSTILSITRERDNVGMVLEIMYRNKFLDDLEELDDKYIIKKQDTEITFQKANVYFKYDSLIEQVFAREDLVGGCHEVAEILLEQKPNLRIMMMVCEKNLVEKYWHSVALTSGDNVIDLTANLVMPIEDFCKMYNVKEKKILTKAEFENLKRESAQYDESKTLWSALRVTAYERIKHGNL